MSKKEPEPVRILRSGKEIFDFCSEKLFGKILSKVEMSSLKGKNLKKQETLFSKDKSLKATIVCTSSYFQIRISYKSEEHYYDDDVVILQYYRDHLVIQDPEVWHPDNVLKHRFYWINSFVPADLTINHKSGNIVCITKYKKQIEFKGLFHEYEACVEYYFTIPNSISAKLAHEAWLGDKESKQVLEDLLEEKNKDDLLEMDNEILNNIIKYDLT